MVRGPTSGEVKTTVRSVKKPKLKRLFGEVKETVWYPVW